MTTTLRDAARAALDALDGVADIVPFITVCKNLRAALAEPEPTQEQTPVAWQHPTQPRNIVTDLMYRSVWEAEQDIQWRPLYHHPAPAQTQMSEEDMERIIDDANRSWRLGVSGARGQQLTMWDALDPYLILMTELHHGIKP